MYISHEQAIITYYSLTGVFGTAIDRYVFPDDGAAADLGGRYFTFKLQVLRNTTNDGSGKYLDVIADPGTIEYRHIRADPGIITDDHIAVDRTERTDGDITADLRIRMNDAMGWGMLHTTSA